MIPPLSTKFILTCPCAYFRVSFRLLSLIRTYLLTHLLVIPILLSPVLIRSFHYALFYDFVEFCIYYFRALAGGGASSFLY